MSATVRSGSVDELLSSSSQQLRRSGILVELSLAQVRAAEKIQRGTQQSSRVSPGSEPGLSPLTEPYVRVSYTAPVSDSSSHLRQDSGGHRREIE